MTEDDTRHGTVAGRIAGCGCRPCRDAKNRYEKHRRHFAQPRLVDATGTRRRIQALMAFGYSAQDLAPHLGSTRREAAQQLVRRGRVSQATAEKVRQVYDRLCMTPGPSRSAVLRAQSKGWPVPLMWDDIDNPDEKPHGARKQDRTAVDRVLVQRALDGQKVQANTAEKRDITRRWVKTGRSLRELERIQGWSVARYKEVEEAV